MENFLLHISVTYISANITERETPLYPAINIISGPFPVFVLKDENIYYS